MKPINLGLCMMYPAPGILERIGQDWDWIWLDGQHGQIAGYDSMLTMVRACGLINRPAYVRIPSHEASWLGLTLDMDVAGVIVPQVDTVEQARTLVQFAKFPPRGNRSYGGRRLLDLNGRSCCDDSNRKTKLVCQIESPEALDSVEQIAAIPGVDALFLGSDDLVLRQGFSMSARAGIKELGEAIKAVANACEKHGKDCFCVAVRPEMIAYCVSSGINFIAVASDASLLANESNELSKLARETVSNGLAATLAPS